MAHESDGVMESMSEKLRVGMMIAAQLAERAARFRQQQAQQARARDQRSAELVRTRFESEREAAVRSLAPVHEAAWWERAQVPEISDAWETSLAWAGQDAQAAAARDTIAREVSDRYGVNVNEAGRDARPVLTGLVTAATERGAAERLRAQSEKDVQLATLLMDQADEYDTLAKEASDRLAAAAETASFEVGSDGVAGQTIEAEHLAGLREDVQRNQDLAEHSRAGGSDMFDRANSGQHEAVQADRRADAAEDQVAGLTRSRELPWDSAERRDKFAADLSGKAPAEAITARLVADRNQGTHPVEAVKAVPAKPPTASKAKAGQTAARERAAVRFR